MLSRRAPSALLPAGGMIVAICLIVAVQLWPSIQHWRTSGANPETAARRPVESEIYGLKLTQMLLPHRHHPLEKARALSVRYNTPSNENESSALGVVAGFGLIVLLAIAFVRVAGGGGPVRLPDKLAFLAVAALMLGTVGGGGAMFAWIVTPVIRAYNRISIFIALLSVAAAMIAIDALLRRIGSDWKERRLIALLSAVVVGLFALWDQTIEFDQARIAPAFLQDREVIQRAEAQLPADTMVYQLPYHPYPEAGPVGAMADYDLLRGFLHSTRLRWSYGGMKGTPGRFVVPRTCGLADRKANRGGCRKRIRRGVHRPPWFQRRGCRGRVGPSRAPGLPGCRRSDRPNRDLQDGAHGAKARPVIRRIAQNALPHARRMAAQTSTCAKLNQYPPHPIQGPMFMKYHCAGNCRSASNAPARLIGSQKREPMSVTSSRAARTLAGGARPRARRLQNA